jgi:hypothetical protein
MALRVIGDIASITRLGCALFFGSVLLCVVGWYFGTYIATH